MGEGEQVSDGRYLVAGGHCWTLVVLLGAGGLNRVTTRDWRNVGGLRLSVELERIGLGCLLKAGSAGRSGSSRGGGRRGFRGSIGGRFGEEAQDTPLFACCSRRRR